MKKIFEPILDEFQPTSAKDVSAFEKRYNVVLPEEFKKFQFTYGRCMFSGEASIVSKSNANLEVFTMFGINCGAGDISDDIETHEEYASQGLVPFADDSFNNRYVIKTEDGSVWYLEYNAGTCNTDQVSDTFEGFMRNIELTPYE
ncbi:hypothetical protein A9Q78_06765 [Methylophaga sp. 41_12_T18]|nr:hypothetical protein A9Q78_06765 [Methylophaga sp. 41_12_T18]